MNQVSCPQGCSTILQHIFFDNMILYLYTYLLPYLLAGLILITKRPTVVAFSSTAFVMDTSFQRPNYDTEDVCKAQHEKGRSTAKETIKIGHAYVLEFWWLCSFQMSDTKNPTTLIEIL